VLLLPHHAAATRLGPNASQSSAVQTLHSRIMDESLLLQLNQNTRKVELRSLSEHCGQVGEVRPRGRAG